MIIANPNSTRLVWKTKSIDDLVVDKFGFFSSEFQLIDEPIYGEYTIKVQYTVPGSEAIRLKTATFTVQEYSLPKFDVSIQAKDYFIHDDSDFNFRVCARYTHGKPFQGNLEVKVKANYADSYSSHQIISIYGFAPATPTFYPTLNKDGCGEVKVQGGQFVNSDSFPVDKFHSWLKNLFPV